MRYDLRDAVARVEQAWASFRHMDRKLPFARTGRIWPYLGDSQHPVVVLDYTPTRGRDGPAKFLNGYKGYLQADAYCVYDAFFKPARGLTEVGCMMHYLDTGVIRSRFSGAKKAA